jgi:lipoprotein
MTLKIILLGIFLLSCNHSYGKERRMQSDANMSLNDSLYISKAELEKLKIDASSGNGQAASKLAHYFAFYEFNQDKFIFWLVRAAESGNTQAQHDLAYIFFDHYQDSKDKNKLYEAEKWALLAQKNGMPITGLLTEIQTEKQNLTR